MMKIRPFQRFDDRVKGLPLDETLYDGVPDWLDHPLRLWLTTALNFAGNNEGLDRRVATRLHLKADPASAQMPYRFLLVNQPQEKLLSVVDAILQFHPGWDNAFYVDPSGRQRFRALIDSLDDMLVDGSSRYQVDMEAHCLVERMDPTLQEAVDAAVKAAPKQTAENLREAWRHAYGLNPDPDRAYDLAVVAIEDLACPLVCPNNPRRTLGTVIRDLGNQTGQWELAIGDGDNNGQPATIDSLIAMLDLIWKGQSRHGGSTNSRKQTQAEADAVVPMAATIVHWLNAGVLRRKP